MVLPFITFGLLLLFLTKDLLAPAATNTNADGTRAADTATDKQIPTADLIERDSNLTYALAKYVVDQHLSDQNPTATR